MFNLFNEHDLFIISESFGFSDEYNQEAGLGTLSSKELLFGDEFGLCLIAFCLNNRFGE